MGPYFEGGWVRSDVLRDVQDGLLLEHQSESQIFEFVNPHLFGVDAHQGRRRGRPQRTVGHTVRRVADSVTLLRRAMEVRLVKVSTAQFEKGSAVPREPPTDLNYHQKIFLLLKQPRRSF